MTDNGRGPTEPTDRHPEGLCSGCKACEVLVYAKTHGLLVYAEERTLRCAATRLLDPSNYPDELNDTEHEDWSYSVGTRELVLVAHCHGYPIGTWSLRKAYDDMQCGRDGGDTRPLGVPIAATPTRPRAASAPVFTGEKMYM